MMKCICAHSVFLFTGFFGVIFSFNTECKLLLISMALWRWSLHKLNGGDRMKEGGGKTPTWGCKSASCGGIRKLCT